jgi:heme-degrading monooxygenase HmoA
MSSTQRPVVRMWHGSVPVDQADPFHRHLLANAVAEMRGIEGFLDATVLHQRDANRVRTLLTTWADSDAVRRYADDGTDAARDYPGDDHFGLVPDPHVTHFELAYRLTEQTFSATTH